VVQQLAVLGHGLGHVLDDFGFHISIPPKVSGEKIYLSYARCGPVGIGSEAITEDPVVTADLHRIDEELLHGILLHSVTSLKSGAVTHRK